MTTIQRFAAEYQEFNGQSRKWSREQGNVLRQFSDRAGKPIEDCNADDFRAYLAYLLTTGLHVNTVRKKANMIRAFFGWAYDVGLIDGNEYMAIRRVPNPKGSTAQTKPNPYSRKELRKFWNDLDRAWPYADEKFIERWRRGTSPYRRVARHAMRLQIEAIVRLALDCGLRRQEIWALALDDIHPDNAYIVVRNAKREAGGAEKGREVPYTDAARAAVQRWLDFRYELKPTHDRPWLSLATTMQRQRKFADPMRWERFARLLLTVGDYGLHRFRHTCATEWLRAGVDLELVSRVLGHATVQQTLAYAKLLNEDVHRAIDRAQPAFEAAINGTEVTTTVGGS